MYVWIGVWLFFLFRESIGISLHKKVPAFDEISPNEIASPLTVNCSESVCTGPLAPIYCHGEITSTAWRFGLYSICPGPKLRFNAHVVVENFQKLGYPILRNDFLQFCMQNFENISYLEHIEPIDWNPRPQFIARITDEKQRKLAESINTRWRSLSRKFSKDVFDNASLYPVVPVPNSFIVPGGFFQTYFYWDTYWINKGLLHSGMFQTVRGILQNFAGLIEKNGFIPNGGELHLSRRSQPPLFIQMVRDYYDATKDLESMKSWMKAMDREMVFWMKNRTVDAKRSSGINTQLFIHKAFSNCPRPENFISDYKLGMSTNDPQKFWRGMASACETGWDFSSRWFSHREGEAYQKKTVRTHKISPVDLNVFMAQNAYTMSTFKTMVNDLGDSEKYLTMYHSIRTNIDEFFWNSTYGMWFDLDTESSLHRTSFYPSNVYPLLLKNSSSETVTSVAQYLKRTNVLGYPGGIPSTLPIASHEQWDFPNVWAPNQHLFILSLLSTSDQDLIKVAHEQALKFVYEVYDGLFQPPQGKSGGLWEKYDARTEGGAGGGGEYPVQEGFGWTNGATIDLIVHLADASSDSGVPIFGGSPHIYIIFGAVVVFLLLGMWFSVCGSVSGRMCCREGRSLEEDNDSGRQPLLLSADSDSD